jgi:hypothetical protein
MPPPRNVAWIVRYDDDCGDPCADVAYAYDERSAVRMAQRKTSTDLFDGGAIVDRVDVERAPQYDNYAPVGPTPEVMLATGWIFSCPWCGHCIDRDGCEQCAWERGNGCYQEHVATRYDVWCSQRCRDEYVAHHAARRAKEQQAIEATTARFPFATKVSAFDWDDGTMFAEFRFTGGKYHAAWIVGTDDVRVAPSDIDAWKSAFEASRRHRVRSAAARGMLRSSVLWRSFVASRTLSTSRRCVAGATTAARARASLARRRTVTLTGTKRWRGDERTDGSSGRYRVRSSVR